MSYIDRLMRWLLPWKRFEKTNRELEKLSLPWKSGGDGKWKSSPELPLPQPTPQAKKIRQVA